MLSFESMKMAYANMTFIDYLKDAAPLLVVFSFVFLVFVIRFCGLMLKENLVTKSSIRVKNQTFITSSNGIALSVLFSCTFFLLPFWVTSCNSEMTITREKTVRLLNMIFSGIAPTVLAIVLVVIVLTVILLGFFIPIVARIRQSSIPNFIKEFEFNENGVSFFHNDRSYDFFVDYTSMKSIHLEFRTITINFVRPSALVARVKGSPSIMGAKSYKEVQELHIAMTDKEDNVYKVSVSQNIFFFGRSYKIIRRILHYAGRFPSVTHSFVGS